MTDSPTPPAPEPAPMHPELRAHLIRMGMLTPRGADGPGPTPKPPEPSTTEPEPPERREGYLR